MDACTRLLNALRASQYEVYRNAQIKRYPDGTAVLLVFNRNLIRAAGFEDPEKIEFFPDGFRMPEERPEDTEVSEGKPEGREGKEAANLARAKRRARNAVFDIARATDFDFFATFTIDPARVRDRMDDNEVFTHLHYWLGNQVARRGLAYVLVPEYHKRGGLHFHALINGALEAVDSGTITYPGGGKPRKPRSRAQRREWLEAGGQPVYNLPGWGFGFSTAIRIYGDREAAIGYVTKYITKSEEKIGGRWYYSGGKLQRPTVATIMCDFTRAAEMGDSFEIVELGARAVRLRLEKGEVDETLEELRRPLADIRS